MEQQIRFCTTRDGVRIAYATAGQGPPLVKAATWLTHLEFDWESPVWRHLFRALAEHHTLIRYDERGTGLSDRDVDEVSLDRWVLDLEAVVDALELKEFPLLGISQGGPVAVQYAHRHPERVSRLILYGTTSGRRKTEDVPSAVRDRALTMLGAIRSGWGQSNPMFRQLFTTMFIPDATTEQMGWFNELQRVSTSPEMAGKILQAIWQEDVSAILPALTTPALVVHCKGDSTYPFEAGRELAALMPNARLVPLEGNNHLLLEDEPAFEQFLDLVGEFLGDAKPAAPASPPAEPPRAIDTVPGIRYATSADGTKIAYEVIGQSEGVPLVSVYAWFVPAIGGGTFYEGSRPCVLYDRRGIGSSQREVGDLSLDAQVADLRAVVDALGSQTIDLIGYGDGAATCLAFAALNPDLVRKVAIWGSFARGADCMRQEDANSLARLIRTDWSLARKAMPVSVAPSDATAEGLFFWDAALQKAMSAEVAATYIEERPRIDVTRHLAAVRAPVLVMHRREDKYTPLSAGQAVAFALPDARLVIFEGESPLLPPDQDRVRSLVLDFLDGAKPAPAPPPPVIDPPRAIDTTPGIRYATSADGTKIAYTVLGGGPGVPLVVISAWWAAANIGSGTGDVHVIRELREGRPVVVYPRRGIGVSRRDVTDVSLDAQVADLEGLIDALGVTEVDLFCVSDGALVGLRFAATRPERVRKLAFWGGFARGSDFIRPDAAKRLVSLIRTDWALARTNMATSTMSMSSPGDAVRRGAVNIRNDMSQEVAAMYIEAIAAADASADAKNVTAPALVLHRRNDTYDPFAAGQALAAALPDARFVPVEGDNPTWNPEDDELIAGPMIEFFDGAKPAPLALAPQPSRPSGVHTILFTDIVSSTALTQRLGDAKMQELVRAHDAIVREALRANAGHEIKHTGDGIMATFGTASSALECALGIARGIAARHDPNLQVHVGLNAGEPVAEDGDIFGASVQLARRLCDHSETGQIVVADVVRQLALGKGFSFSPLPEATLKGFDEAVRAYELVWRQEAGSGPDGLTAREVEVLRLIAAGRTNTEIATELTLSVRTVARHITNIYTKIGARNKAEATDYVHRNKLT